jgi:hypothetical protein
MYVTKLLVPHGKRSSEVPLCQKILLTFFWDMKGPILERQEKGPTVNSAAYSAMLKDQLKHAVCSKRRGLSSKTVLLHHDSARPLVGPTTIETI